jgi:hypothetical protein
MELVKFTDALKTILPWATLLSIPLKLFALRPVGFLEVEDLKIMMSQKTYTGISSPPIYSSLSNWIQNSFTRNNKEWECLFKDALKYKDHIALSSGEWMLVKWYYEMKTEVV